MSHNPGRRLKRQAMRAYGWTSNRPASGRRRGAPRLAAEQKVAQAAEILKGRR